MKLIKKLTTILFAFMMVLSATTMVFAEGTPTTGTSEGSTPTKGTITINSGVEGQDYTIYRIFDLESYNVTDPTDSHYAYKANSKWKNFLKQSTIKDVYVTFDDDTVDGYVSWKTGANQAEFAKLAIKYAKEHTTEINKIETKTKGATELKFEDLDLGYYLVDTSLGALCSLDTTNPNITINEKNEAPTIDKKVSRDNISFENVTNVNVGDTVYFKATITAKPGADNYVFYDKMDTGFSFPDFSSVKVTDKNGELTRTTDYDIVLGSTQTPVADWTFKITFKETYLETLRGRLNTAGSSEKITITYSAKLNKDAVLNGNPGNENEAKLTYGDKNTEITSTTKTFSYSIPVFKFYQKDTSTKQGLADAVFELSRTSGGTAIELIEITDTVTGATDPIYRPFVEGDTEAKKITQITTKASGKFEIRGLKADTYQLEEVKQPNGFNKPKNPFKFIIDETGEKSIFGNTASITQLEIENKTGTILPSTGGMGTTIMYIVGAVLLIGSGVVLVTKKNAK